MSEMVSVRYVQGRAEVQVADSTLVVRRRDAPGGPQTSFDSPHIYRESKLVCTCPVDLVTAALGS